MDEIWIAFLIAGVITLLGSRLLPRLLSVTRLAVIALVGPIVLAVLVPLTGDLAKDFSLFELSVSGLLMVFGAAISGAAMIAVMRTDG